MVAGDLVNTASRVQSVGRARDGPGRRDDAPADRGRDRLRGRGRARAQGQGRAGAALARTPRRCRARRRGALDGPRGSVRRARGASCAWSRSSSTRARTSGRAASCPVDRRRRDREVAARLGVREVHRRPRRRRLVAPRPLPLLRRGRRLLGARRDGAHAGRASLEEEPPEAAPAKLRACVELHVADAGGARLDRAAARASARPRRARGAADQEDLFSAWRRFIELLADAAAARRRLRGPPLGRRRAARLRRVPARVVARTIPIFVLTLARPELLERRPTWGAGRRSFHSIVLEPLADEAREELIDGLAPGPPRGGSREQIRERAEGVPLYAVETVRMLLDRGLLAREDGDVPGRRGRSSRSRCPRPCTRSSRPDSTAWRPSRTAPARGRVRARQDVHAAGAGGCLGRPSRTSSNRCSTALVRKEILTVNSDPRSPERGQYGFLHALFQRVAYDTLVAEGAEGPSPGRRRDTSRPTPTDDGGRRGHRVPLSRCLPSCPGRRRCSGDQGEGARAPRARGGARRVARRDGGGSAVLRAGSRPRRRVRSTPHELLERAAEAGRAERTL